MLSTLILVVVVLLVVGIVLYLINNYLPLDPGIRKIINIVVAVIVIIWLLLAVLPGLFGHRVLP